MSPLMTFFHHLHSDTIFGLLGNTISFMVFLSPIPTFLQIYKEKSTQGYQGVPYVVALFSSMLWILYAFLTPNSTFLKTANSFGCFIETIYIVLFLFYATKKAKIATTKLIFLMNVAGFGAIVFITFIITKTTRERVKFLGWICLIFSLCVFVAPLGVMRQVIRTKSVKYMPFLLSFFLTISAIMWFFYGLVRKDYYVAIPNVLGFTFGIVQMVLYAMYRNSKRSVPKEKKIPSEVASTIKLPPQETLGPAEASEVAVKANSNNVHNANEEGVYTIEIHDHYNVHLEMIERMKKIEGMEVEPFPNNQLVTVAA